MLDLVLSTTATAPIYTTWADWALKSGNMLHQYYIYSPVVNKYLALGKFELQVEAPKDGLYIYIYFYCIHVESTSFFSKSTLYIYIYSESLP